MPPKLTFYDVLSTLTPPSWSSNAVRTRLALNYLRLPYTTVFLSYPDIEPTLSRLGLPPNGGPGPYDKKPRYTLPVIRDGETWVSGSFDIALYLSATYPPGPDRPDLFPGGSRALARLVAEYLDEKLLVHARKLVLPKVPGWLDDKSATYFRETRERWLGVPLEEYYADEVERSKIREEVLKGFAGLAKLLREETGPFFQGGTAGYSDLQVMAVMAWIRRGDPESWERAVKNYPEIGKLFEARERWLD